MPQHNGGLLAVQKSKFRKSEPFREQYKRYVRTSRPSLQSLIIYIIIMYKNLAMLWTLNCILFDAKNKNKMIISLIDNEKGELLK